mgnify:CR=1 FL=1
MTLPFLKVSLTPSHSRPWWTAGKLKLIWPLTLSMIRALHRGLGIPAESLLQEPGTALDDGDVEWNRFPIRDMVARGWASEARIYAEDPNRKFMPSTGRLIRYREPVESDEVRVDSGVVKVLVP